jgi:protein-disulfide isomerase
MSRQIETAHLAVPVNEQDHVRGPATGAVTLVEYGDFQCPSCGEAFPIVEALIEQLGGRLRLVFRNFPLTTIHPFAEVAAESAEAAGSQGKFWEMHRLLFENQAALETESLARYGASIGLDERVFVSELANHTHFARVRADFLGGAKSGVNGTPTFFINGARHDGSYDLDALLAAIERAMP